MSYSDKLCGEVLSNFFVLYDLRRHLFNMLLRHPKYSQYPTNRAKIDRRAASYNMEYKREIRGDIEYIRDGHRHEFTSGDFTIRVLSTNCIHVDYEGYYSIVINVAEDWSHAHIDTAREEDALYNKRLITPNGVKCRLIFKYYRGGYNLMYDGARLVFQNTINGGPFAFEVSFTDKEIKLHVAGF